MTSTSRPPYESSSSGMFAFGVTSFAGIMLATVSVFQILEGIAAVAKDDVFVRAPNYTYSIDVTSWGWVHLAIGVIGLATAIGILMGQTWGRILGVFVAFLGTLANFTFIPYYPLWSLIVIAFWILTLWALCSQLANED